MGVPIPLPQRVDWRNRWGWNWITTIRDQRTCNACESFALTALIESMTRIEHGFWASRSEGDLRQGAGLECQEFEDIFAIGGQIIDKGIADPDCWPWQRPYAGPILPYHPTADRSGRTAPLGRLSLLLDRAQAQRWLYLVGPVVAHFVLYDSFRAYNGQLPPYREGPNPGPPKAIHAVLVVGYDDAQNCWIVKNSWFKDDHQTPWGDHGFGLIAYDACAIDAIPKLGLRGTDPDPWTKRRLHNGVMLESGNGAANRDFELFRRRSGRIEHWRRLNSEPPCEWREVGWIAAPDAADLPDVLSSTFRRSFEIIYPRTAQSGGRLHHWSFRQPGADDEDGEWLDRGAFGPASASGVPGFIQGSYGTPGDYEVVVRTVAPGGGASLEHWTRQNGPGGPVPEGNWYHRETFGNDVAASGPALVQSTRGVNPPIVPEGGRGPLEVVCALNSGSLRHFIRPAGAASLWAALGPDFGDGDAHGPPCMIESQLRCNTEQTPGDLELCVAVSNGQFQHWRYAAGSAGWAKVATAGQNVRDVVALIQSSFTLQLELIVRRTDGKLQHYWYDSLGWHEGAILPEKGAGIMGLGTGIGLRKILLGAAALMFGYNAIQRLRGEQSGGRYAYKSLGLALFCAALIMPNGDSNQG